MNSLKTFLQHELHLEHAEIEVRPVHGGDIHHSFELRYHTAGQPAERLFVKQNNLAHSEVLESEFSSLQYLVGEYKLDYPRPILCAKSDDACFLVMAFHNLSSLSAAGPSEDAGKQLGEILAQQHRITAASYGWPENNYIGLTPQPNTECNDWLHFYAEHRLQSQLTLARHRGLAAQLCAGVARIIDRLSDYFAGYTPQPSLLHGDLWSGNFAYDLEAQQPLLFDPAPYFGDREADIAMTELFGGFPVSFYQAYQQSYPLHGDYPRRKPLYNLYHALNHFNLFGGGYAGMVSSHLDALEHDI